MNNNWHRPLLALQLSLLFLAYPYLLLSPVGTGWIEHQTSLRLPVLLMAGAIAGIWLLRVSSPQKGPLLGLAVTYSVWTLCSAWMSPRFHLEAVLNALSWPWIILQFALVARQDLRGLLQLLRRACSLLFLISCLHSWLGGKAAGLAGNPNWHAALLLACSFPFAVELRALLPKRQWSWPVAAGLTAAIGLQPLLACSWRTGLLVLPVLAVWSLCLILPQKRRPMALLLIVICAFGASVLLMKQPAIREKYELIRLGDVRGPLWAMSLQMSKEKPLIGQGAGNFQREAWRFDSVEHMRKLNAPDLHEHPHMEPLRVACEQGWLSALIWIGVVLWAFFRQPVPGARCLSAAALVLLVAGCTDKALFMPPGCLLFPMLIGLMLHRQVCPSEEGPPAMLRFAGTALLSGLALAMSLLVLSGSASKRSGDIAFSLAREADESGEKTSSGLLLREAADDYSRAAKTLFWEVEPAFLAARVYLMNLHDADAGLPWLERSESLEAAYAQSGRMRYLYHRLKAEACQENEERIQHLEAAAESLAEDLERHQGNINLAFELYQFLAVSGGNPESGWSAFLDIAVARGEQKLRLMETDAESFRQQLSILPDEQFLPLLNELFGAIRFQGGVDPSLGGLPITKDFPAQSSSPTFIAEDLVFFRDRLVIAAALDHAGRQEAAVQKLMAKIVVDLAAPFTFPGATLRLERGNALSRFCLEAELRRQAGLGEFRAPAGAASLIWAYPQEWAPRNAALAAILKLPSSAGPSLRLYRLRQAKITKAAFVPAPFTTQAQGPAKAGTTNPEIATP